MQAGAEVKMVQCVMRHSDNKLALDRYAHPFPGSEAAARLRSTFAPPHPLMATGTDGDASGAHRTRQQSQSQMVQNPATGCDSLGGIVALATGAEPD